jgi:hypothetical protein
VAIQAVLIFSDASVITPTNFAFAFNLDCDRCYTLATAYQFVSTTGIVRFTAEGNRRLAAIRQELEALRHSGLSIEEIQARVDMLAGQLLDVMRTELVSPGPVDAQEPIGADKADASVDTAPTAPADAESAGAEEAVDSPTEASSTEPSGEDSSGSGSDPSQTTAETTSEPAADTSAESGAP